MGCLSFEGWRNGGWRWCRRWRRSWWWLSWVTAPSWLNNQENGAFGTLPNERGVWRYLHKTDIWRGVCCQQQRIRLEHTDSFASLRSVAPGLEWPSCNRANMEERKNLHPSAGDWLAIPIQLDQCSTCGCVYAHSAECRYAAHFPNINHTPRGDEE